MFAWTCGDGSRNSCRQRRPKLHLSHSIPGTCPMATHPYNLIYISIIVMYPLASYWRGFHDARSCSVQPQGTTSSVRAQHDARPQRLRSISCSCEAPSRDACRGSARDSHCASSAARCCVSRIERFCFYFGGTPRLRSITLSSSAPSRPQKEVIQNQNNKMTTAPIEPYTLS